MTRRRPIPLLLAGAVSVGGLAVGAGVTAAPAASAVPATAHVTVVIEKVSALDELDGGGEADFYPEVYIGGQSSGGPHLEITDRNNIQPNWTFSADVPFTSAVSTAAVRIEIYDADGFLRFERDHADVTTGDADRNLDLSVRLLQCARLVPGQGLAGDKPGSCDQSLGTDGEASDRARLQFRVTTTIPDSDGDGLYDTWEANGYDATGSGVTVDLPAMGARVDHKDLFVELDAVGDARLSRADIEAVKRAFAAAPLDAGTLAHELPGGIAARPNPDGTRGITLHVDTGAIVDPTASEGAAVGTCGNGIDDDGDRRTDAADRDCVGFGDYLEASAEDPGPANCTDGADNDGDGRADVDDPDCLLGDNLGGGGLVTVREGPSCNLDDAFYATKADSFSSGRADIFRYGLLLPLDASCASAGGWGELGGNDFMVFNTDAGSLMHELGHNLNLNHGGFEARNCKPNYVSVMNYDLQAGVQRVGGGAIVDYAPPRRALDGSSRGAVPGRLDEAALDEDAVLDTTDDRNRFVFTDSNGNKRSPALNSNPNYNADTDPPHESGLQVNIDTANRSGIPADCGNMANDSKLDAQNDWQRISLPFSQFGDAADGPVNPVTDPNLTTAQLRALDDEYNAADLHLSKTGPATAVAGRSVTYQVSVRNDGPATALPMLTDTVPPGATVPVLPSDCTRPAPDQVRCVLAPLREGGQTTVALTMAFSADLVHNAGAPVTLTNTASVAAARGRDPDPADNTASARTRVFAEADLSVAAQLLDRPTELIIGEPTTVRIASTTANAGPSTPMDVRLTTTAAAQPGADAQPASQSALLSAVATGGPRAATTSVTLSCAAPGEHRFDLVTDVSPDRPDDTDPELSNNRAALRLDLDCVVPVALNLKPAQSPNSVNRNSSSDVPAAVLTTTAGEYGLPLAFDAASIEATAVRFGQRAAVDAGRGGPETHQQLHLERSYEPDDRTRDGDLDGVLHFNPTRAELASDTRQACVKGKFRGPAGQLWTFLGCDSIRIVK
ncbi:MAG TPA: hypothetical protein VFV76_12800 [Actinomycetes bacterium]|nr:hypothetical protein [Actinomycetes bacterium]